MSETEPRRDWYQRLLAINEAAFDAGHYEVAYHALMSALHAAQDLGDPVALQRIERVAAAQQDRIDADAPYHRLSSQQAGRHGALGIFRMAARQAGARSLILARRPRREGP